MKKTILSLLGVCAFALSASAASASSQEQPSTMGNGATNLQVFYDFGGDRRCVTTTVSGFYNDPWGNTFFFVDHDYNPVGSKLNPDTGLTPVMKFISGTYWEIERCLNFWQNSPVGGLSVHLEYQGGVYSKYGINHAFLVGLDYFLHSKDFKNTFNFKLLYKNILYDDGYWGRFDPMGLPVWEKGHQSVVPLQFTFVWGRRDLFGVQGLSFNGFLDVWGQEHYVAPRKWTSDGFEITGPDELSHVVMITEPQIWYSVGQHFGCPNLNVGTEIELSVNFGGAKGFWCRPCLGLKWVF